MKKFLITFPIPFDVLSPIVERIISEIGACTLFNIVSTGSTCSVTYRIFPRPGLNLLAPGVDQMLVFALEFHRLAADITQLRLVVPRQKWSRVLTPQIEPAYKKILRQNINKGSRFFLVFLLWQLTQDPVYRTFVPGQKLFLPTLPPQPADRLTDKDWDAWFAYYYLMQAHGQKMTLKELAQAMGRHYDCVRHKKAEYDAQYQDPLFPDTS